ncbi:MAG: toll/interleukin-1 receptor domain-containing protein [Prevotella sp.]|nr:toll/interleukin-1 receptor domain-containing protein [Prevotella sp.]
MEQMKYNAFISYSRKDYLNKDNVPIADSAVGRIVNVLKQNGIEVWIDIHDHYAGEVFPKKLGKQIREADNILFVSSFNSNESDWVAKELNYAYQHNKTIIPIRIDETPFNEDFDILLAGIDYIDYYKNEDESFDQLVQILSDSTAPIVPIKRTTFLMFVKLLFSFFFIFIAVFGILGSVGFAVGYFENIENTESLVSEAFRNNQFSAIDNHTLKYVGKTVSFTFDVEKEKLKVIKEKSTLIEYSIESITLATAIPLAFSNLFKSARHMGNGKTKVGYIITGSIGIIIGYGIGKPLGKSYAISKNEDALEEIFEDKSTIEMMKQKLLLIYQ